jgi:DNA-binding MarR family transcriptional regulator
MTTPRHDAPQDQTPAARLDEGPMRAVVGYQLAQASIVTSQVFMDTVGQPSDLRPVEYTVLALVVANPGVSARQLARALGVAPPNMAVWLERLQTRKLIDRRRSAADARVQHVKATPGGARLAAECTRQLLQAEAAALAGLSPAERAMLAELLHKAARSRRRGT